MWTVTLEHSLSRSRSRSRSLARNNYASLWDAFHTQWNRFSSSFNGFFFSVCAHICQFSWKCDSRKCTWWVECFNCRVDSAPCIHIPHLKLLILLWNWTNQKICRQCQRQQQARESVCEREREPEKGRTNGKSHTSSHARSPKSRNNHFARRMCSSSNLILLLMILLALSTSNECFTLCQPATHFPVKCFDIGKISYRTIDSISDVSFKHIATVDWLNMAISSLPIFVDCWFFSLFTIDFDLTRTQSNTGAPKSNQSISSFVSELYLLSEIFRHIHGDGEGGGVVEREKWAAIALIRIRIHICPDEWEW